MGVGGTSSLGCGRSKANFQPATHPSRPAGGQLQRASRPGGRRCTLSKLACLHTQQEQCQRTEAEEEEQRDELHGGSRWVGTVWCGAE